MALVDQRILIPAPMNVVWEVIADHRQLAKWRRDCKTYSLLSTHHVGVGVRRRVSPPKGKDFIEEFMAWYNNFGYEYKLVDNNKDYKHHLSRIRLQATPEGTIVQWTIEYQVKGFWVNLLGKRRRQYRLERMVVDSLRDLRRHVQSMGVLIDDDYRTKASVQDAPDAEKRLAYGAKIFAEQEAKLSDSQALKAVQINEPPVRPDDTPSIAKAPPPSFILQNFEGVVDDADNAAYLKTVLHQPDSSPANQKTVLSYSDEPAIKTSDTKPRQPVTPADLTKTKPAATPPADDMLKTVVHPEPTGAPDDLFKTVPSHKTEPPTRPISQDELQPPDLTKTKPLSEAELKAQAEDLKTLVGSEPTAESADNLFKTVPSHKTEPPTRPISQDELQPPNLTETKPLSEAELKAHQEDLRTLIDTTPSVKSSEPTKADVADATFKTVLADAPQPVKPLKPTAPLHADELVTKPSEEALKTILETQDIPSDPSNDEAVTKDAAPPTAQAPVTLSGHKTEPPTQPYLADAAETKAPSTASVPDSAPPSSVEETKPKRPKGMQAAVQEANQAVEAKAEAETSSPITNEAKSPETIVDKRATDTMSIWEVFGVNRPPIEGGAELETQPPPTVDFDTNSLDKAPPAKSTATLDDWLAMEEPPLPASASSTMQTLARFSQKPTDRMGLRKRQRQATQPVRRPKRPDNDGGEA